MVRRLAITALVLSGLCSAAESSSSGGYLDLPDTLSHELQNVAQEGFLHGFGLASAVMIATGGLCIALHLINRSAGR